MMNRVFNWRAVLILACLAVMTSGAMAQDSVQPPATNAQVVEASKLYADGKPDAAVRILEEVVKADPKNGEAHSWLGFIYLREGMPDKAVSALTEASKLRPDDLEVLINLGGAQQAIGDNDGALGTFKKIVARKPDMAEAHYNIGVICLSKKDFAGAKEHLISAQKLSPNDAFIRNNLGAACEGLDDNEAAADHYVAASNMKPENPVFARNAGAALLKASKLDEAMSYLERAIKNGERTPQLCLALGQLYLTKGRAEEALKAFALGGADIESVDGFWYNVGVAREQLNDPKGAEDAYRRTIAQGFQVGPAHNNLGLLLYNEGRYEEAAQAFGALYQQDTKNSGVRLSYASALQRSGKLKDAAALWREHLKSRPGDNAVRLDLATALWHFGDIEGSKFHYSEVLKSDATNYRALNGVGLYQLEKAKFADAEKSFRAAVRSNRQYAAAYNNLAVTLERLNRMKEAFSWLEMAMKLDPNSAEIKENFQRIRTRLGK